MKVEKIEPNFTDHRGSITDILGREEIDYVTLITSKSGVVRGNHYHKKTYQWVYVLSGSVRAYSKFPGRDAESELLEPGDLILNEPLEVHALQSLTDSSFIVLTRGPRGGEDYEDDTFRVDVPLVAPGEGTGAS